MGVTGPEVGTDGLDVLVTPSSRDLGRGRDSLDLEAWSVSVKS